MRAAAGALVPLVLDYILRNTRQIADSFASLTPMPMRAQGGDGVPVRFVPVSKQEAVPVADEQMMVAMSCSMLAASHVLVAVARVFDETHRRDPDHS